MHPDPPPPPLLQFFWGSGWGQDYSHFMVPFPSPATLERQHEKIFWSQKAICDLGWAQNILVCVGGSHSNSGGKGVYICSPWDLDTRQGYKWGWGGHVGIMFLRQLWWRALLDMGHLMGIGHSSATKIKSK